MTDLRVVKQSSRWCRRSGLLVVLCQFLPAVAQQQSFEPSPEDLTTLSVSASNLPVPLQALGEQLFAKTVFDGDWYSGALQLGLRINGLTRTYSFVRQADHLLATSAHVCGFVAMQGAGSHAQQVIQLPGDKGVTLRFDEGLPTDPSLLDGVLDTARAETWTGVTVASQEPIGTLQMYLSTQVPAFCFMSTTPELATGNIGPTGSSWCSTRPTRSIGGRWVPISWAGLRWRRRRSSA